MHQIVYHRRQLPSKAGSSWLTVTEQSAPAYRGGLTAVLVVEQVGVAQPLPFHPAQHRPHLVDGCEFVLVVAALQAENRMLLRELATVHATLAHERDQSELLAKAHEQLTRALPAPAADAAPARAPWWRRAFVRTGRP